jgi:hypothetical protein
MIGMPCNEVGVDGWAMMFMDNVSYPTGRNAGSSWLPLASIHAPTISRPVPKRPSFKRIMHPASFRVNVFVYIKCRAGFGVTSCAASHYAVTDHCDRIAWLK